jgi:hypothetical protein
LISWSDSAIHCNLSAGSGHSKAVSVEINLNSPVSDQFFSAPSIFAYQRPSILGFSPTNFDTLANSTLILTGMNFGTDKLKTTVLVGPTKCPVISVSDHHTIECSVGDGTGIGHNIVVEIDGLNSSPLDSSSIHPSINFNPPVLTSTKPVNGPTSGSFLLTIFGKNFGTVSSVIGVSFLPNNAQPKLAISLTSISHTSIRCVVPAHVGSNTELRVIVADQSGVLGRVFSYDAPIIDSVGAHNERPTSGGFIITIFGHNFGNVGDRELISIQIGQENCLTVQFIAAQSVLQCIAPSGA